MGKIIIGIHGLGNKPSKNILTAWWKKSMHEGLDHVGKNRSLPRFELLYWADVLYEKPLSLRIRDKSNALYVDEPYTKAPYYFPEEENSTRQVITDFLGKQLNNIFLNEDLSLNYSFITNAIIHRYFRELEIYYLEECTDQNSNVCKAKDIIKERTAELINKHANDDIFIVAHSMGSIIAFDVLTFLIPDVRVHTLVTMGSPLGLPVVISKIAAEHHQNQDKSAIMKTPSNVVKNWYNYSDIHDLVAFNYKLGDDFTANGHGIAPRDFLVQNNYMINDNRNPHKSYGYLRVPEFSNVLSEFMNEGKSGVYKNFIKILHKMTV